MARMEQAKTEQARMEQMRTEQARTEQEQGAGEHRSSRGQARTEARTVQDNRLAAFVPNEGWRSQVDVGFRRCEVDL